MVDHLVFGLRPRQLCVCFVQNHAAVMTRRRLLLIICLILLLLARLHQQRSEQRLQRLRDELGPGRGRVPRSAQRRFPAIDVYSNTVPQGDMAFVASARFTREQFDDLVEEIRPAVEANRRVRQGVDEPSGDIRQCKLTVHNRVLLALRFLVTGGTCGALSRDFGLARAAVSEELRHMVFALAACLSYEVEWPDNAQMALLRGAYGVMFPNAVGSVDGTFTPSPRRAGDFSGHRYMHLRSHQVVSDAFGYIIHAVCGQIGARHDAYNFERSQVPALLRASNVQLLADAGYVGQERLVVPMEADGEDADYYNEEHTRRRSRIEALFGRLKLLFTAAGRRWIRCDLKFLAMCVFVTCLLHNRVKRLND